MSIGAQAGVSTYYNSTRYPPPCRKPRLDVPGDFYHLLARGNRRATIFHDDADSRAYLERFERYRQHDGVTLHAYKWFARFLARRGYRDRRISS